MKKLMSWRTFNIFSSLVWLGPGEVASGKVCVKCGW